MGDNLIYLGKSFSFDINNVDIKAELLTDMSKYFNVLNRLTLFRMGGGKKVPLPVFPL